MVTKVLKENTKNYLNILNDLSSWDNEQHRMLTSIFLEDLVRKDWNKEWAHKLWQNFVFLSSCGFPWILTADSECKVFMKAQIVTWMVVSRSRATKDEVCTVGMYLEKNNSRIDSQMRWSYLVILIFLKILIIVIILIILFILIILEQLYRLYFLNWKTVSHSLTTWKRC